jgi:hypothetical protein
MTPLHQAKVLRRRPGPALWRTHPGTLNSRQNLRAQSLRLLAFETALSGIAVATPVYAAQ